MKYIIFSYNDDLELARNIAAKLNSILGDVVFRRFPDNETYVRINTDVQNKKIILVCSLNQPDTKLLSIIFFAATAKQLGAKSVGLIAPYLAYMRQDIQFQAGEAINSRLFASLLSQHIDWLITIDPHLHRHKTLAEIYTIPVFVLHAAVLIAQWIKNNIKNAVLIGPDEESKQWVTKVAELAAVPSIVLKKIRHGDREVEISVPNVDKYQRHTPVLVDDIISTGKTMIETAHHLHHAGMQPVVCIGIHAVFVGHSYSDLLHEHVAKIITCNTIKHITNKIDVSELIAIKIKGFLSEKY
jgi:ribose-phosphate pyrophosphokinase